MGGASVSSLVEICCARVAQLVRQESATYCVLGNGTRVLLSRFLGSHIAIGDEITFAVPTGTDAAGPEACITKNSGGGTGTCLHLAAIESTAQPKSDKRGQPFVSARIRNGNLGISSIFLPCDIVRDYFYGIRSGSHSFDCASLYETLRIATTASPAEIRIAFKLRSLELESIGGARTERVKLERAFNILGNPELRAHYDTLLSDPDAPALFPYGGCGSLLVTGDRSSSGETFFARRIVAFVPEQTRRHFHIPLRRCDFYDDKALCRDVRRHLEFWLDPVLLHVAWDPSWNRWKHLLSSKIEVDGTFVRSGRYKKRGDAWEFVDWETGLPSRLSMRLPTDFAQDIARARSTYCRFGHYSRALDQMRLCLEYKAIERKELERMCSELGIPGDFDVAQISWRPDYNPFFYRHLSDRARRIYMFRNEYLFELERAVVGETPQLGHATYVFAKPRSMESFLALYAKISKEHIRRNRDNVAERLGFLGRVIHGTNPRTWLKEMRQRLGERISAASAATD